METLKAIARIEEALRRARDTHVTPYMQSKLAEIADTLYHLFPEETLGVKIAKGGTV